MKLKDDLDNVKPNANIVKNIELIIKANKFKKSTRFYQKLAIIACLIFLLCMFLLSLYLYNNYPDNKLKTPYIEFLCTKSEASVLTEA